MTIDDYTLAMFGAGVLAGVALTLNLWLAREALWIWRYLRSRADDRPKSDGDVVPPSL